MADFKYTKTENISRWLVGRLELISGGFGQRQFDPEFLDQLHTQAEARLDGVLKQLYTWPLVSNNHPILAEYIELKVCCSIVPTYFHGQGASNDGGFKDNSCKEAEKLLTELKEGTIALDGETRRPDQEPKPLRSVGNTISGRYKTSALELNEW
jgi:phage gp36-like protein